MLNLLAQAAESDDGGSGLIEVVPGLMIWTLICFGIAFFVLRKYAFGPIQKTIDDRRERIRNAVQEADNARAEAARLLEEHRALIGQAKQESADILAEARKVAESQADRAKQEAEADRQRRLEETRKQIEAETARAIGQIRSEVADLTVEATQRVVGKVLDREDQRRLIEEAVEGLDFSALERRRS
jgi:F-type H+-transporting ATPase subunit b